MYAAVSQNLIEGVLRPRPSFRRILDLDCGGRDIGLMVLFGYLLTAIFTRILYPELAIKGLAHITGAVLNGIQVLFFAWLAWFPPKLFGGTGRWKEALQASAWLSILLSMLAPLFFLAIGMFPSGEELDGILRTEAASGALNIPTAALGLLTFCVVWVMWLFSAMIAEVHGFATTWKVMATIFAAVALMSMLLTG